MRRAARFLAVALPAALATVPVALAGADTATGGESEPMATVAAMPVVAPPPRPAPALIASVRPGRSVAIRSRPSGPIALRVDDQTEFGSARKLGVVRRHGRWLGVTTPELPNGRLGWVDRRQSSIALARTRWSIRADVSRRRIVLRRGGRIVRRLDVAVGRPGSPTPTGRFAVTDKIEGSRFGPYYGCCILAISATQPNTPSGWTGGNRMAIHGTSDPSSIGGPVSAGCLRAADPDLRFLMERVPVGTPVVIRR